VRWRGVPLPTFGLGVEFRAAPDEHGSESLDITGTLSLASRTGAHAAPRVLGVLRYQVSRAPMA
jgi:hypothetical protein